MREWPESQELLATLARASRARRARAILVALMQGALVATPVAAIAVLLDVPLAWAAASAATVILAAMTVAHFRFDRSRAAVARDLEAGGTCRNLVVTAEALLREPGPTPAHICRVVIHDAVTAARTVDIATRWPVRTAALRTTAAVALLLSTAALASPAVEQLLPSLVTDASSAPVLTDVRVIVTPPAYIGGSPQVSTNPERVTALVGSRVSVEAEGPPASVTMATASTSETVSRSAEGTFAHTFTLSADGFVALTPADAAGNVGVRRLIGLTATVDRPPSPKVTAPGKDLFLREATNTLPIEVEAGDDFGLRSLRLAYTKVAGVGESFTFTEGEVPLSIERVSGQQWRGRGELPLASLNLEIGDMVVYRAVAADNRPGATPVESDSFIIEIVSASEALSEGFAIDDTRDKYALSQQMVILKTERLIARTKSRQPPDAETIREESLTIAAEQRSVRAELVFMMGGHFEDEFVEAAHEHEISDGRFDNSGRADLGRAVRDMARAATELVDANLDAALAAEKLALEAMERALSRRRFILRTLSQRESIDDTRRLTGRLGGAAPGRRGVDVAAISPEVTQLRAVLALLADLQVQSSPTAADAARLSQAGEALLTAAPSERDVVDIVAAMSTAGEALATGNTSKAGELLRSVSARITSRLRTLSVPSGMPESIYEQRLKGAMSDVISRGGGRD